MDLAALQEKGVAAFNSPYSSTRSVAELTLGSCIHLMRRI
jgi:D-3-phosphoglycerate dehydrogenase